MAARPLNEIVEPGWAKALDPVAGQIAAMGDFLRAEIAAGRTYLPAGPNVLRAFQQPFDEVRVLIVGQDPYPTPGHAVGLSFSVAPEVRPLPGSLENIFRELRSDLGVERPSNGDLTPWTRQGVLLLNRALTTAPRRPAAHRGKGWEAVTEQAIRALAERAVRWWRFCGGGTRARCARCSARSRRWNPRIPPPCPPTAGSSVPARSAAPTTSSYNRAANRSTGVCPDVRRGGGGPAAAHGATAATAGPPGVADVADVAGTGLRSSGGPCGSGCGAPEAGGLPSAAVEPPPAAPRTESCSAPPRAPAGPRAGGSRRSLACPPVPLRSPAAEKGAERE